MHQESTAKTILDIFEIFFKTCTPPVKITNFADLYLETQRMDFRAFTVERCRTLRSTNPAQVAFKLARAKLSYPEIQFSTRVAYIQNVIQK